ncbi:class I SAM-dependent methyltransferase [Nocardioides renjunii]|uniref:class I SAM-dependent methyltransferase n=1 Tax=Nocardioides renjunii TaxID=3095075 RepID=UPI002AFFB3B2|nr:class I SAM-dependent methyltransferase [Nocardioides sp. S-34]WQQ21255.1 class I SAM-dependent methyltransferase [Nocardioides sp. S-34]
MSDVAPVEQAGSSSIDDPTYWWYAARNDLLRAGLGHWVGRPARVLDVGSADGPSAHWLPQQGRVAVDLDPRGLVAGRDACASALALPFRDATFDLVAAFDVVEHCEPESQAVAELARVLSPGGRLLVSVPAYQWAWSDHDVRAGHHRRYTRRRIVAALEREGLEVERVTHAFALVFPMFVAERLVRRLRPPAPGAGRLPRPAPAVDRLLRALCRREVRLLARRDLPFGSSILVAAVRRR